MQTLKRERRQKFREIIRKAVYAYYKTYMDEVEVERIADELAEAAESRSERKTDETAAEYNVELMRGDVNDYPEHLREIAKVLRDTWLFRLPEKPKGKKTKGQYQFYVSSMDNLKQSCAEFGADVLVKLHADWRAGFKNGIAPYTIANPQSLVNVASGKAREMREAMIGKLSQQPVKRDDSGAPITY